MKYNTHASAIFIAVGPLPQRLFFSSFSYLFIGFWLVDAAQTAFLVVLCWYAIISYWLATAADQSAAAANCSAMAANQSAMDANQWPMATNYSATVADQSAATINCSAMVAHQSAVVANCSATAADCFRFLFPLLSFINRLKQLNNG